MRARCCATMVEVSRCLLGNDPAVPLDAAEYLGGGEWRRTLPVERGEWPAAWPQLERLRYRSADATTVLTFEGHGHYGEAVRARSQALSDAGFTPPYLGQEQGFGRHAVLKGRVAGRDGLTPQLLARMAEYCAWRTREFCMPDVDASDLMTMTRVNLEREFGAASEEFTLSAASVSASSTPQRAATPSCSSTCSGSIRTPPSTS